MKDRFQHKIDTSKNWEKAKNFTPLLGEIILYSELKKIKIGDGQTKINDLDFWEDTASYVEQEKTLYLK